MKKTLRHYCFKISVHVRPESGFGEFEMPIIRIPFMHLEETQVEDAFNFFLKACQEKEQKPKVSQILKNMSIAKDHNHAIDLEWKRYEEDEKKSTKQRKTKAKKK